MITSADTAMKEAAGDQRDSMIPEIAERLHLRPSTVYTWTRPCEDPTDSGQRGPLKTLIQYIESCIILGRPKEAALSPLRYANHHFNQVCFTIPEHIKSMSPDDLNAEMIRCMKEVGDVVASYQVAVKNKKRAAKKELKDFEREVWEAATELMVMLYCMKECAR